MHPLIVNLTAIDHTKSTQVGGKAANLGEISSMQGIRVPPGFCITTRAYQESIASHSQLSECLDELATLKVDDRRGIRERSARIHQAFETMPLVPELTCEIEKALHALGEHDAYAVRSSATAEDLPTTSFAGQQDSYLNIVGKESILKHISKCWGSLFNERAIIYRLQNGFDHRNVQLAVIVQKMVFARAAGVLFTADPLSGHRGITSINASFGLGEALVSGLVNPDTYKVCERTIVDKTIGVKEVAIVAQKEGGYPAPTNRDFAAKTAGIDRRRDRCACTDWPHDRSPF